MELGGDLPVARRCSESRRPGDHRPPGRGDRAAGRVRVGDRHGPARSASPSSASPPACGLITLAVRRSSTSTRCRPILAAMIGLGVGIDYALFIVTRHRENLRRGHDRRGGGRPGHRHVRARPCCSPAPPWSSPSCGLAIAGIPAVTVMGLMAACTVAVMVAISLTLLPGAARASPGTASTPSACRGMRGAAPASGPGPARPLWHRWGRQVVGPPVALPRPRRARARAARRPASSACAWA